MYLLPVVVFKPPIAAAVSRSVHAVVSLFEISPLMWTSLIGVWPNSGPAAGSIHAAVLFTSTIRENLELSDPAAAQVHSLAICYMQTPVEIAQHIATLVRHSRSAPWVSSTELFSLGVVWAAWMPFSIISERAKSRSADFRASMYTSACQCVSRSLWMILECQYSADEPHPSFKDDSAFCIPVF